MIRQVIRDVMDWEIVVRFPFGSAKNTPIAVSFPDAGSNYLHLVGVQRSPCSVSIRRSASPVGVRIPGNISGNLACDGFLRFGCFPPTFFGPYALTIRLGHLFRSRLRRMAHLIERLFGVWRTGVVPNYKPRPTFSGIAERLDCLSTATLAQWGRTLLDFASRRATYILMAPDESCPSIVGGIPGRGLAASARACRGGSFLGAT